MLCDDNLTGKPKINVEGEMYCYRCAKKEVMERKFAKREAVYQRYLIDKECYDQEKARFDRVHYAWHQKRQAYRYLKTGNLGCLLAIGAAVVFYNIAAEVAKGWGGLVFLFLLFFGRLSHPG
jgi:hypothetical protein